MKIVKRKTQKGVINAVYKLLSDKEHWTRGADAVNRYGAVVAVKDPQAERFCLRGALRACSADQKVYVSTYRCLSRIGPREPIFVNDNLGYEAVMALLKMGKNECK